MEYTYETFQKAKEALGLTGQQIAEIIGTTHDNVRKQIGPTKKLPTWARAIVYVHSKIPKTASEPIMTVKAAPEPSTAPGADALPCKCVIDENNLFRRDKNCKLPKQSHKHLL